MSDGEFLAHYGYAVAQLEFQVWGRDEVYTISVHAGNVGAKVASNLQLADALAVDARFGNQDSAVDEFAAEFLVLYVNLLAEQGDDRFFYGRMSHNLQNVALFYHGLSVNHLVLAFAIVTDNLGNHEVALQEIADLLDGIFENHLVRNLYGEGVQGHRFKMSFASLSFILFLLLVYA